MGDGLPSFAPQWLKSGSSSALGAGTHTSSSSTASREEVSKGWRDSGSRLGWGAGTAEREAEAKSVPVASRRQAFQERSRSYSGDRSSFRPSNGRILSDRELVEETTSLKLRPAQRASEPGFLDEPFPPHKNGDRGFPGRGLGSGRGGARKPGGISRSTPLHPQTPEREFSGLSRPAHAWLAGGSSPKSPAPDQPWTSRLADKPLEAAAVGGAPEAGPTSPAAPRPAEAAPKPAPRMADAILQAQSSAGQEADAAKAAKLRMEQLALRQSKQLMPVIAGSKQKQAAPSPLQPSPSLTPLKKPQGMEPLGRVAQPAGSTRREEEPPKQKAPAAGVAKAGNPARERDRAAFFGSLRRKTSSGDQAHLTRQESGSAAVGSVSPQSPSRAHSPGASVAETNGRGEAVAVDLTPEEVAFMRSLGWEEAADDDGGLTEEEVAQFLARYPNGVGKPGGTTKHSAHDSQATTASSAVPPRNGYHSELEFSDSGDER